MALGEDGAVLFANAAARDPFFKPDGDGEKSTAALYGLAELAQRALANGRCNAWIHRGEAAIYVAAVRVEPNGAGKRFVAVKPADPPVVVEPDAAAVGATISDEAQEDAGDASREPALADSQGGAAPSEETAFTEAICKPKRDEQPPADASAQVSGPIEAAHEKAGESVEEEDNILPFRIAMGLSPSDAVAKTGLQAHERDAFKALAQALGARMEGAEEEPARDLAPASTVKPVGAPTLPSEDAADRRRVAPGMQEIAALLAHLPIGLLIYRQTVPLYANRAFLDLFGCGNFAELDKLGDVTALLPKIKSEPGIVELRPGSGEQRMTTLVAHDREGRAIPVLARLQAVRWAGEPAILLSVRPAAAKPEQQPAEPVEPAPLEGPFSAQELVNIVNLSSDGIVVVGGDGRISTINDRAAELLCRYVSDVAGKPFESLFVGDSRSIAADYLDGLRYHGIASVLGEGRKVRARLPNGDEVPLYLTMGEMSADRARRFCAILRDLSQWTRAETELVRARKAAEAASAHKSDLLARISHEIRTPLNSIIGFSEVMLEGRFGNIGSDRYRDYVRDIHASGKHLLGLVNDLLDLSKVEAGKLELNFTRLDVNGLAQQCVRLMQPEASQGRIIMRSSLAPGLPAVVADHRSLRQILLNLLSNAIKFTLPGGQVVVSTSLSNEGEVQIRVRDTGVGMDEKDIALALEPFRQIASAANSRTPGTGLGLPLTKALAEVNRAHFRIESAAGEGTLTEITFPSQRVLPE
jgi:PAS domain S-box-containing protein